ncbi:MAG: peptidoglycan-binding protein [Eubacteriales bacterium]|nr:peptidoglycan-binding protein [Eubacteriales bacterium]
MKRSPIVKFILMMAVLAMFPMFASAEDRVIVPTENWTPPVLDSLTASDEPQLLLLQVAQQEVGYVEGPKNDETKYGEWFAGGRVAWCSEFITWCVDQVDQRYGTDLMNNVFPWYGGPSTGAPFFIKKGRFISDTGSLPTNEKQWLIGSDHYLESNEYIPYAGDYIWFYYYNRSQGTDHVGLVEGVSQDADGVIWVHVIEGNNPDRVQRAVYALTDSRIYGFGTPVKRAYTNLRIYNNNDDVLALQANMETLGYYQSEAGRDSVFTLTLQAAVKKFQKEQSIRATGIVDMDTRLSIETALAAVDPAS